MRRTQLRSTIIQRALAASLTVLTMLLAAPGQSLADPCSSSTYSGCLTDPASYRIRYSFSALVPITNIVDMWSQAGGYVHDQGDFPASGQISLPLGTGVIDAGYFYGEDEHYLVALSNFGGSDHVVVMMSPATAALVVPSSGAGLTLEDMANGNPVDPMFQYGPGEVESIIIDRLKNQPAEWNNDIDQYFRFSSRYPNRLLPALLVNNGGSFVINGGGADFVMVAFSTGTVIGGVSVEIVPVPEPETWLLVLAGIGLLAWRLRSTRRKSDIRAQSRQRPIAATSWR